jgi:hypothetical protein
VEGKIMGQNGRPASGVRLIPEGRESTWWCVVIAAIYIASLFLPAFYDRPLDKGPNPADAAAVSGGEAFLHGLFAVVLSVAGLLDTLINRPVIDHQVTYWIELGAFAWFANPTFLLGLLLLRKKRRKGAGLLGLLSLLMGITTVILIQQEIGPVLVGYYFWILSIGLLILSGFIQLPKSGLKPSPLQGQQSETTAPISMEPAITCPSMPSDVEHFLPDVRNQPPTLT